MDLIVTSMNNTNNNNTSNATNNTKSSIYIGMTIPQSILDIKDMNLLINNLKRREENYIQILDFMIKHNNYINNHDGYNNSIKEYMPYGINLNNQINVSENQRIKNEDMLIKKYLNYKALQVKDKKLLMKLMSKLDHLNMCVKEKLIELNLYDSIKEILNNTTNTIHLDEILKSYTYKEGIDVELTFKHICKYYRTKFQKEFQKFKLIIDQGITHTKDNKAIHDPNDKLSNDTLHDDNQVYTVLTETHSEQQLTEYQNHGNLNKFHLHPSTLTSVPDIGLDEPEGSGIGGGGGNANRNYQKFFGVTRDHSNQDGKLHAKIPLINYLEKDTNLASSLSSCLGTAYTKQTESSSSTLVSYPTYPNDAFISSSSVSTSLSTTKYLPSITHHQRFFRSSSSIYQQHHTPHNQQQQQHQDQLPQLLTNDNRDIKLNLMNKCSMNAISNILNNNNNNLPISSTILTITHHNHHQQQQQQQGQQLLIQQSQQLLNNAMASSSTITSMTNTGTNAPNSINNTNANSKNNLDCWRNYDILKLEVKAITIPTKLELRKLLIEKTYNELYGNNIDVKKTINKYWQQYKGYIDKKKFRKKVDNRYEEHEEHYINVIDYGNVPYSNDKDIIDKLSIMDNKPINSATSTLVLPNKKHEIDPNQILKTQIQLNTSPKSIQVNPIRLKTYQQYQPQSQQQQQQQQQPQQPQQLHHHQQTMILSKLNLTDDIVLSFKTNLPRFTNRNTIHTLTTGKNKLSPRLKGDNFIHTKKTTDQISNHNHSKHTLSIEPPFESKTHEDLVVHPRRNFLYRGDSKILGSNSLSTSFVNQDSTPKRNNGSGSNKLNDELGDAFDIKKKKVDIKHSQSTMLTLPVIFQDKKYFNSNKIFSHKPNEPSNDLYWHHHLH